jgi:hypothetical protein
MHSLLPPRGIAGLVVRQLKAVANNLPHLPEIDAAAARDQLHQQIADRRGLDGPRHDRAIGRIGDHLAQETVLYAATHHVHPAHPAAEQLVELTERPPHGRGHALQGRPHDRCRRLGHGLAARLCQVANRGRHVGRGDERRVVGVDEGHQRWRLGGEGRELVPGPFLAGSLPGRATLLHEPQAANVFEEPRGASHAPFVGEVVGETLGRDERAVEFGAHQCPGAEAHVAPVRPRRRRLGGGHCRDGAGRIVGAGHHHSRTSEPRFGRHIGAKIAEIGARLDERAEDMQGKPEAIEECS